MKLLLDTCTFLWIITDPPNSANQPERSLLIRKTRYILVPFRHGSLPLNMHWGGSRFLNHLRDSFLPKDNNIISPHFPLKKVRHYILAVFHISIMTLLIAC